jgi:hypothetical protein
MPVTTQAVFEAARFLASGPAPEEIIAFHPSDEATERIYELIEAEKNGTISDEEQAELDRGISLEYMMGLTRRAKDSRNKRHNQWHANNEFLKSYGGR